MSPEQFSKSFDAGMQEHSVVSACFDLHWAMQDKDLRAALQNPESVRSLKKARDQLDAAIRKLEIAPIIEGECREARQVERMSA